MKKTIYSSAFGLNEDELTDDVNNDIDDFERDGWYVLNIQTLYLPGTAKHNSRLCAFIIYQKDEE